VAAFVLEMVGIILTNHPLTNSEWISLISVMKLFFEASVKHLYYVCYVYRKCRYCCNESGLLPFCGKLKVTSACEIFMRESCYVMSGCHDSYAFVPVQDKNYN
jgi:hypothetical protein